MARKKANPKSATTDINVKNAEYKSFKLAQKNGSSTSTKEDENNEETKVYCIRVKGGTRYKGPYGDVFIPLEDDDTDDAEEYKEEETEESYIEDNKLYETFGHERSIDKNENDSLNFGEDYNGSSYIPLEENLIHNFKENETEENSVLLDSENKKIMRDKLTISKVKLKIEKPKSKLTITEVETQNEKQKNNVASFVNKSNGRAIISKVIIKKEVVDNLINDDMPIDEEETALSKREASKHKISVKKEKSFGKKNISAIQGKNVKPKKSIKIINISESNLKNENVQEGNYKCRWCFQKFSYELDLMSHVKTHGKEDTFPCGKCHKTFSRSSNRDVHLRNVHKLDDRQFSCKWCLEKFFDKSLKDIHLQGHTKGESFLCNICEKTFSRCANRNEHLRTHTGQQRWKLMGKPIQCSECPMTCLWKNEMRIHSRIHTGEKPYICKMCPKSFTQSSNLNTHTKLHTGEKDFSCNQCEKSFSQKSGLNIHIKMHLGIKDISCSECTKSFASKQNLMGHMRVHTGEKPFTCEQCPKQFAHSKSLKIHVMTHTDIKPVKSYVDDNLESE